MSGIALPRRNRPRRGETQAQFICALSVTVEKVPFEVVASLLDWSDVYGTEGHEEFLKENGLEGVPYLALEVHSRGQRRWTSLSEDTDPPYFTYESCEGGWRHLREGDVSYVRVESDSKSSLSAQRYRDNTWNVTLQVPMMERRPYRGAYWDAFHEVFGLVGEWVE